MTAIPEEDRNARLLIRRSQTASLATVLADGGGPYASLVSVATDLAGLPLLLVSRLAWHTQNLLAEPRASLLFAAPVAAGADPLTGARVSVQGQMQQIAPELARARYLARHPQAALYAGFADFSWWRIVPQSVHLVAGFGRIATLTPEQVFLSPQDCAELGDIIPSALSHMAEDHADSLRLYATRLLGAEDGAWEMAAIDGDGADLKHGERVIRLEFPELVRDGAGLRRVLAGLAAQARLER